MTQYTAQYWQKELMTTCIPDGHYVSKTKAAAFLGIEPVTLQSHIKAGYIKVILFPDLGYLIEKDDLFDFALNRRGLGRPTIHSKE